MGIFFYVLYFSVILRRKINNFFEKVCLYALSRHKLNFVGFVCYKLSTEAVTKNNGIFFILRFIFLRDHSMTTANLNKSEDLVINTTTASKYIPRRLRICINWNFLFKTQIYLVKAYLSVNIAKQDLRTYFVKSVLENIMKWSLKGGFQLMLILGLLSMYVRWFRIFQTSRYQSIVKATVSGVFEDLAEAANRADSGQLQFWSEPSEILNLWSCSL